MKKIVFFLTFFIFGFTCSKEEDSMPEPAPSPNGDYSAYIVTVNGNISTPLASNIQVEKGDFVFVEVLNKISLGFFVGKSYGDGITGFSWYNKYNCQHGALVTWLGNAGYATTSMSSVSNPIYYQMVDPSKVVTDGLNYLPCQYFFAEVSGNLSFDVNDIDPQNNEGSYLVYVYVLKQKSDIERNKYNRCPKKEPISELDCEGEIWINEGIKAWFYHGIFNTAYRGTGKNKGCQCVYDNEKLVTDHADQGTFDYGFWEYGDITDPKAKHLHMILDVIPHDAWNDIPGNAGKTKMYNNPIIFCN